MKQLLTYKHIGIALITGVLLLLGSCKSSETTTNRVLSQEVEALLNRLETESYRIDIRSARPFNTAATQRVVNQLLIPATGNSAGRIDVAGDGNYLAITDSIASAYLPFFGEQRQGGGYYGQQDSGITMDSAPKEYTVAPHKKKDAAMVAFTVADSNRNTEHYDISIMVFPSGKSEVSVISSHRTQMAYSGILEFVLLPKDNEAKDSN